MSQQQEEFTKRKNEAIAALERMMDILGGSAAEGADKETHDKAHAMTHAIFDMTMTGND
jgi:hypothetical protein